MIQIRWYIYYKLLNSLFLGLSVGSIFVLYTPLKPSIYSLGGICLAVGMLILAKFYDKLMNTRSFFYITLFVEFVVLVFVFAFLVFGYSYMIALSVYIGYQLTFMFGNYLLRVETVSLKRSVILGYVDVARQKGYLAGMVASYLFYKLLEFLHVEDKQIQVYWLHIGLFMLQIAIIYTVLKAFKREYTF